jgi:hypothetical protein
MFKIGSVSQTYLQPVEVEVPNGGGKTIKHIFKARFKRKTQAELDEIHRRLNALQLKDGEELLSDDALLREVMDGWEDVLDGQDQPQEFNEENLATLLDIYPTRPRLVKAFFDSIQTSKRKN